MFLLFSRRFQGIYGVERNTRFFADLADRGQPPLQTWPKKAVLHAFGCLQLGYFSVGQEANYLPRQLLAMGLLKFIYY